MLPGLLQGLSIHIAADGYEPPAKKLLQRKQMQAWFYSQFFKAYHEQFGGLGSCFSGQSLILRSVVPGSLDFQVWLLLPSY